MESNHDRMDDVIEYSMNVTSSTRVVELHSTSGKWYDLVREENMGSSTHSCIVFTFIVLNLVWTRRPL